MQEKQTQTLLEHRFSYGVVFVECLNAYKHKLPND